MPCFVESVDIPGRRIFVRSDHPEYRKRIMDVRSRDAVAVAVQGAKENGILPAYIDNQLVRLVDRDTGKLLTQEDLSKYGTVPDNTRYVKGRTKSATPTESAPRSRVEDPRLQPELVVNFATSPSATFAGDSYPVPVESEDN